MTKDYAIVNPNLPNGGGYENHRRRLQKESCDVFYGRFILSQAYLDKCVETRGFSMGKRQSVNV